MTRTRYMDDYPVVIGVPVHNPANTSSPQPSAPPLPPAAALETQLAQCVHCQRLGWREDMVRDETTGQYRCRRGCALPPGPPRGRAPRCCAIS